MSSHDARYEDSPAHGDDAPGKTSTQTGQSPFDRYTTTGQDDEKIRDDVTDTTIDRESAKHLDDTTVDGRPVEIPVDPKPEPTTNDGRGTTPDSAPVTISDGPFATPVTAVPVASQPATSAPATAESVVAESVVAESETSTTATSESATSGPVGSAPSSSDVDWRELQGRFVDDPEGATKEAGALLERALSELRSRSESGSTEELRTAFRRYRDLYNGLS